ncbi:mitochondrial resolvase Ydc2 [Microdochium trichocladiopsis]|uniref:Mitochondrial resolvase Ydc2 n=1 Tax=Microdochium trichocladiopsis TaxID=1682393 RepID=A0A9P9C020_9PEZI|nr:mitochondrial resolvase Ydc2 [Microdochium trichocladiopsis]KAH7040694.1 mitochondrial resolvase Ydc2 [Microdochium trichocladiopsis]
MPPVPPGLPVAYSQLIAPQLRQVLAACGLPHTGRRQELLDRLADTRASWRADTQAPRVLSIDLGLRNFGFALMSPVDAGTSQIPPRKAQQPAFHRQPVPIHLHAWERLELVASDADTACFAPDRMAAMTWDLLQNRLLPMEPTHIVMERQRSRTLSGPKVQEWTLRVNVLEAMLHAMLKVLITAGKWQGAIMSVPPGRATQFWLGSVEEDSEALAEWKHHKDEKEAGKKERYYKKMERLARQTKGRAAAAGMSREDFPAFTPEPDSKTDIKAKRMYLVKEWLKRPAIIQPETPAVRKVQDAFITTSQLLQPGRAGRARVKKTVDKQQDDFTKLDDLADCLCQGMAWLVWQHNRSIFAQSDASPLASKPTDATDESEHELACKELAEQQAKDERKTAKRTRGIKAAAESGVTPVGVVPGQ